MVALDGTAPEAEAAKVELYGLLSGAFTRELTADMWGALCAEGTREGLRRLAARCGVPDHVDPLLGVLSAPHTPGAVDDLAVDYARLFIGPGPGLAPPYESVYTTSGRRFYGDAVSDVQAVLRAEGIQVADTFRAPADHISVELSIMQFFAQRAAERGASAARYDVLRKRLAFLDRHLLRWVPYWVVDVRAGASTGFYREIAGLLEEFLARDAHWLRSEARSPPARLVPCSQTTSMRAV